MFSELRKLTGHQLPLSTLLQAPTLGALTALLRTAQHVRFSSLVPLQPKGSGRPVFLVHGLYGNVLDMKRLADLLDIGRPIHALQPAGLDPARTPHDRVETMAAHYIDAIRTIQTAGPYTLAGHSFGGLVAFEMARQLKRAGDDVDLLALFDTDIHEKALPWSLWLPFQAERVARIYRNIANAGLRKGTVYLYDLVTDRALRRLGIRALAHPLADVAGADFPAHYRAVHSAGVTAVRRYRPKRYAGRVIMFRADEREAQRCDPLPMWRRVSARVDVYPVTGGHLTMMAEPHVSVLAAQLRRCLALSSGESRQPAAAAMQARESVRQLPSDSCASTLRKTTEQGGPLPLKV
jgi:acetoacetyl-CoA synthetase